MNPSSTPMANELGVLDNMKPSIEGLDVAELSDQDMINIMMERFGPESANEKFFTLMAKNNPEGFVNILAETMNKIHEDVDASDSEKVLDHYKMAA